MKERILLSLNGDTRTYNSLLQLTRVTVPGVMDMQYNYTAGQNNGRIGSSTDYATSETVSYGYDSLNRLSSAWAGSWGENFSYDGYGNLTAKTPTAGSPPSYNQTFDPSLNAPTGSPLPSAMPSCNAGYVPYYQCTDVEDRSIWVSSDWKGHTTDNTYDPWGRLVYTDAAYPAGRLYVYGIGGEKLVTYKAGAADDGSGNMVFGCDVLSRNEYFAGYLITWNGVPVVTDRLGSVRAAANGDRYTYYPYGEQHTATGTGTLGLYADLISPNRNYDANGARWGVPDRAGLTAADPKTPATWNRFAYANGDPINYWDPGGADGCPAGSVCMFFSPGSFLVVPPGWTVMGQAGPTHQQLLGLDPSSGYSPDPPSPKNWQLMPAALAQAFKDLAKPGCGDTIFAGGIANGHDPADVLQQLADGTKYGSVDFKDLGSEYGAQEYVPVLRHIPFRKKTVLIDLNTEYWNNANTDANALILIHELGHAFNDLFGKGSATMENDASLTNPMDQDAEDRNKARIEPCAK